MRPHLRFLPRLSDDDLASLYAWAAALVCPSRYEGYQFPLLEARSAGGNVVATDIPVHREVSQGSALLVPPGSPEALADGIARVLAGERPTAPFGPPRWADTARDTLDAYRRTAARA